LPRADRRRYHAHSRPRGDTNPLLITAVFLVGVVVVVAVLYGLVWLLYAGN
jgi:hypothetical protein